MNHSYSTYKAFGMSSHLKDLFYYLLPSNETGHPMEIPPQKGSNPKRTDAKCEKKIETR